MQRNNNTGGKNERIDWNLKLRFTLNRRFNETRSSIISSQIGLTTTVFLIVSKIASPIYERRVASTTISITMITCCATQSLLQAIKIKWSYAFLSVALYETLTLMSVWVFCRLVSDRLTIRSYLNFIVIRSHTHIHICIWVKQKRMKNAENIQQTWRVRY